MVASYARLYGQDAYLFMDINLIPCAEYGPNENITCATEGNVSALFDAGLNFDVAIHSQISRGQSIWRNMYLDLEQDRWGGTETHFITTESHETQRILPLVEGDPVRLVAFETFASRSTKADTNTHHTFYFRSSNTAYVETIRHFTAFDCFNSMGGSSAFVASIFGFVFGNFNRGLNKYHTNAPGSWVSHVMTAH